MLPSACKLFAGIGDPRGVGRSTHGLAEILFAAPCAILCRFGCCDGYAQFAKAKVGFPCRHLPQKDGTPFHDTFGRLLLHSVVDVTMGENASLVRRNRSPPNRATLKRVALNAVRVVTGKNLLRCYTIRDAVLNVRVLTDILDH